MKTILITIALLIGLGVSGQQAKLDSWYAIDVYGDTIMFYDYVYDSEDSIKFIYCKDNNHDTTFIHTYKDDRIVKIHSDNQLFEYEYFDDTVVYTRYINGEYFLRKNYTLNENYENTIVDAMQFEWSEGNMIRTYNNGNLNTEYIYDSNYINPWYQQNKYFKRGNKLVNNKAGNYNVLDISYDAMNWYDKLIVKESIGVFPTILEHHENNIGLEATYYFTYYDIVSGTPEIPIEPYTVHTIDYYDLYGRKITKPTKGFYIERKKTNKGIISTKHFIQ